MTCPLPVHPVSLIVIYMDRWPIRTLDVQPKLTSFLESISLLSLFGPPNYSPVALETEFGWVLAGRIDSTTSPVLHAATHLASLLSSDDLLRQFWEIEENLGGDTAYTPDKKSVVQHFRDNHFCTDSGRFAVPLPRKPDTMPLGESRSKAVRRFFVLECSLISLMTSTLSCKSTLIWDMLRWSPWHTWRSLHSRCSTYQCMLSGRSQEPLQRSTLSLTYQRNSLLVCHSTTHSEHTLTSH